MDVVVWAIVSGIGLLVGAFALTRSRRGPKDLGDRFVLRVHVGGKGTGFVTLGTSVETGDVPESEPTLASVEIALLDDGDQTVVVPANQRLIVRAFEGAERKPLEAVTTLEGTGRRYSFDVAREQLFWILDAPGWRGCLGTADPGRRRLPPRAEGYEITTRLPPEPELDDAGSISVTMADLTMPLWMHGLEGPDDWLLGARASAEPSVAIAAFTDPHLVKSKSPRDSAVGSACFHLLDTVWLETAARATVGIPIVVSRARVFTPEPLRSWEAYTKWHESFSPDTTFVWGAARADLESEGFDVRVRRANEASEVEIDGPLEPLRKKLLGALETRGIERVSPRAASVCARARPVPIELDGAYSAVCDLLFLLMLSHPANQALPSQEPGVQRQIVDLAKELAEAAPASGVARLLWIVAAIYAHGCGGLAASQRDAVLTFVRASTETDDCVRRLQPAIFHRLGEAGAAVEACKAALETSSPPEGGYRGAHGPAWSAYREWLEKVLEKAQAA